MATAAEASVPPRLALEAQSGLPGVVMFLVPGPPGIPLAELKAGINAAVSCGCGHR
jgi:hypothetical protein